MNRNKLKNVIFLSQTSSLTATQRRDLLEVLENRYDVPSTIITSQLDTHHWHLVVGDETITDAICDRPVHYSHRIKLKGKESMHKKARDLSGREAGARINFATKCLRK